MFLNLKNVKFYSVACATLEDPGSDFYPDLDLDAHLLFSFCSHLQDLINSLKQVGCIHANPVNFYKF